MLLVINTHLFIATSDMEVTIKPLEAYPNNQSPVRAFANYTVWKWRLEKKEPWPGAQTRGLRSNAFQLCDHQCGHDSLSPIVVYTTVTGRLQYCDHLGLTSEGFVQWCAQRAARMCICKPVIYTAIGAKNHGHIGGSCGWNSVLERRPQVQAPGRDSFFFHFQAV